MLLSLLVNFRAQGHGERHIQKINEEHYMKNVKLKWYFLKRRNSCNLTVMSSLEPVRMLLQKIFFKYVEDSWLKFFLRKMRKHFLLLHDIDVI